MFCGRCCDQDKNELEVQAPLRLQRLGLGDDGLAAALGDGPLPVAALSKDAKTASAGAMGKLSDDCSPETYEVMISKGNQKLGIDINHYDTTTLLVTKVNLGPVSDHNAKRTDLQITSGDRILEINGVRGEVKEMLAKIKQDSDLRMTLQRLPESTLEISRAGAVRDVGVVAEVCDGMTLIIHSIEEGLSVRYIGGALQDARKGDRIIGINNVRGDAAKLKDELAGASLPVTLTIRRILMR